jgi:hypothetical protein
VALRYNKWWATDFAFDPIDVEFGPLVFPGDAAPEYYEPPAWDAADFNFYQAYTPQSGFNTSFEITATSDVYPQYVIKASAGDTFVSSEQHAQWRQFAYPSGFSTFEIGAPRAIQGYVLDVEFADAYTPPAWNAVYFGFAVEGSTPTIYPDGYNGVEWGTAYIDHKNRTLNVTGSSHSAFGTPFGYNAQGYIYPYSFSYSAWGTPSVVNINRYFDVWGATHSVFGTPTVSNYTRTFSVYGSDFEWFGYPSIMNWQRYFPVTGVAHTTWGTPAIWNTLLDVEGFGTEAYGWPLIGHDMQPAYPVGVDHSVIGTHRGGGAGAIGVDQSLFGTPHVQCNRLNVVGWDSGIQSLHRSNYFISLFIRTYNPPGKAMTLWGNASIDNWLKFVNYAGEDFSVVAYEFAPPDEEGHQPGIREIVTLAVQGFDGQAFGSHIGTNWLQYEQMCGRAPMTQYGTASIGHA